MTRGAFIAPREFEPDTLASVLRTTTIKGSRLRPGMVLVDPDLKTPEVEVRGRLGRAGARTGDVKYLTFDYDARRARVVTVHENAQVEVMAR